MTAAWLALVMLAGCDRQAPAPQPTASATVAAAVSGPEKHLLAFGDSLFTGYGLRFEQSYPARLEAALRAKGIDARMTNAGVSGDTTADGAARIAFALSGRPKPDLLLVSLGGNDMLRGLPPAQTRANLEAILSAADQAKVPVLLMGMLAAPNLGKDYAAAFDPIYPALAKAHHAALVPFFLAPVIGHPDLQQADHIHPTVPGVEAIVSATLPAVEKELGRGS
jgi:acyl-CoA thioesterase-1